MNIFKRLFKRKQANEVVTIKTSWDEITVQEMMDITSVIEDEDTEDNKIQSILSILTDKDFDYLNRLPVVTYTSLANRLAFLQKQPTPNKLKKSYTINGHKYIQCADVSKITTAQFIDYNNYMNNNEKDISKILSVMLIPDGCEYGQGYNIEDVQEDIKSMLYKDALAVSFFLQKQFVVFVKLMVDYLGEKMKKVNLTKEQRTAFNNLQRGLKDMASYLLY